MTLREELKVLQLKKESLNERISIVKDEVLSISKKLKPNALDEFSKITYPNFWLLQSPKDIAFQIENFLGDTKSLTMGNGLGVTVRLDQGHVVHDDLAAAVLLGHADLHETVGKVTGLQAPPLGEHGGLLLQRRHVPRGLRLVPVTRLRRAAPLAAERRRRHGARRAGPSTPC